MVATTRPKLPGPQPYATGAAAVRPRVPAAVAAPPAVSEAFAAAADIEAETPIATPARTPAAVLAAELLGEVITWTVPAGEIEVGVLRKALDAAGFDPAAIKDMLYRNAFSRACRTLSDSRVIRKLAETETEYRFQFTREYRGAEAEHAEIKYAKECVLVLTKADGLVTPEEPSEVGGQLALAARTMILHALAHRTAGDVTRIVQKLFEAQADLFPIREQGGAYFVPAAHKAFVDRVELFLLAAQGRLLRFPVPKWTDSGNRSVRQAMADGLSAVLAEYREAVNALDADTRPGTFERQAKRLQKARLKVDGYSACLADERDRLLDEIAAVEAELAAKLEAAEAAIAGPAAPIEPSD